MSRLLVDDVLNAPSADPISASSTVFNRLIRCLKAFPYICRI